MQKIHTFDLSQIREISPCVYEIPKTFVPNMRVHGIFYATPEMAELAFKELREWEENPNTGLPSILQISYVATLPGIASASFGMPDMHSGYGFAIGGIAAFDTSDPASIISPGGVGYDINCGVRCISTNLNVEQFMPHKKEVIDALCKYIPTGVGGKRKNFVTKKDVMDILRDGAKWAVKNGYGEIDDLENCEEGGCLEYSKPELITDRAKMRGIGQLGTLGAGNHYIEVQVVDEIFNEEAAKIMGIKKGMVVVMVHTGSRGLGYQVAEDFIKEMEYKFKNDNLPDPQLSSAPFNSEIGQRYYHSMGAAANFAWCNRQIITHFVRVAFKEVFKDENLEMHLIYDVSHNIAKVEKHVVDGVEKEFIVHRKGATRSFGPGRKEIPIKYRKIGQPVLVGGSLGTASYILLGTDPSKNKAFGSTCHGAGRTMSRSKASREINPDEIKTELEDRGIEIRAANNKTVIEEAPITYKDIEEVVEACDTVGVSSKVARLLPIGVIKG